MAKHGLKERLESLSDAELKALILSISGAAGLSPESTHVLTDDIPSLRKKLCSLGDGEIAALLSAFGTKNAESAISKLKFQRQ